MVIRLPSLIRLKVYIQSAPLFMRYVLTRYRKDRASSVAAALAYTSLLSLVPLMAIGLAMLAAFPVFSGLRTQIEDLVFTNFVPAVGEVVQNEVSSFVGNAGRLSAAGIIGLGVTAIMLLVTIETAFNGIFRVDKPRTALSRLLVYWTMMTLGPLLVGASLSVQGYLASLSVWQQSLTFTDHLAALLPTLFSVAAFTVMFATIPNRQVPPLDALFGGVVAGLLFAMLRWIFAYYIIHSGAYTTLYGAVAAVPIVLFWMFLSWMIVLIGAEITAALSEWRAGYALHSKTTTGERRLALALETLFVLHEAAQHGSGGTGRKTLLTATTASESELMGVVRKLFAAGYAAPTNKGRILLGRDLNGVTLLDLVETLDLGLGIDDRIAPETPWRARVLPLLALAHSGMDQQLGVSLAELFQDKREETRG